MLETGLGKLRNERRLLNLQLSEAKQEIESMKEKILIVDTMKDDDCMTRFYIGFSCYPVLEACFTFLEPSTRVMCYWRGSQITEGDECNGMKTDAKRKLPLNAEFLMVMVRLKLSLTEIDLGHRFGVDASTVSMIFITWINLMHRYALGG